MNNPLRHILDIRKQELPVVVLLFAFFFLVIVVFQMLRPLKEGLFIEHYGAYLRLYARLANIAAAAGAVAAFTYLYNRLPRQQLIYVLCLFFIVSFIGLLGPLKAADPGPVPIWFFYILVDLVTTLLVAGFWAYATDLSSPDQAKRLFGVVGGGGIIGGLVGVSLTKLLLPRIGMLGLIAMGAASMALVILATFLVESQVRRTEAFRHSARSPRPGSSGEGEKTKLSAAVEGARLVFRSPYLAAIVGIMAFYEMASQIMDYQFSSFTESLKGVTATQAFIANVGFYANLLSVAVQFLLVSLIMRKLGLVAALLVLPLAITASSGSFLAIPTLAVASLLYISDNGLNYSIQQTARESLYVVTTPEEKYKARAFTNMFVQRVAKGLSIVFVLGLGVLQIDVRFLSLITVTVTALMILCSLYAGREFTRKSRAEEPQREAA